jgi:nucleotide-binding universal stress UspA family protein
MAGEIILGYDGQQGSQTALRTATSVAAAFKSPLVIVFGYAPPPMGGQTSDLSDSVQALGEKITDEAATTAKGIDPSIEVKTELVNDRAADALLRAADQYDARAIVVGAAGRGPLSGALLGSVTYQVVHRSTRPVLVVPSNE